MCSHTPLTLSHAPALEEQLLEEDMRVTARGICWPSSCLRWVDRLPTSGMVVIFRQLGSSSKKSSEKYASGDEV